MQDSDDPTPLYWDDTYAIALRLIEKYPDLDLESVGIRQLYGWILALPGFADEPNMVNDGILHAVLREWYEEVASR